MPVSMAGEHRTVSRVTTILERVAADHTGVRLTELAAVLDAPRSSVHGLVKGLVATGYLREEDGAYLLGPAVGALLMAAPPTLDLTARPEMEKLHRQFDETVMLASQVGDSVVYTNAIESTRVIRYSAPLHTRPLPPFLHRDLYTPQHPLRKMGTSVYLRRHAGDKPDTQSANLRWRMPRDASRGHDAPQRIPIPRPLDLQYSPQQS